MIKGQEMDEQTRLDALGEWGERISELATQPPSDLIQQIGLENPWFTPENIKMALQGVAHLLDRQNLSQWISPYELNSPKTKKKVGVIAAGNIPLVGFHDFLSVLAAGQILQAKLSRQDQLLPKTIFRLLLEIEPRFENLIQCVDRLYECHAIIATGSNNTARYFQSQWKHIPNIIRKSRGSCAILSGEETQAELSRLGTDVFSYFGLGCRNVCKLYIPQEYDFRALENAWQSHTSLLNHRGYQNRYRYQKAIFSIEKTPYIDFGFTLLTARENLISPIATLHYETYKNPDDLGQKIEKHRASTQCVVGRPPAKIPFGKSQLPEVWQYADDIDTIAWLGNVIKNQG